MSESTTATREPYSVEVDDDGCERCQAHRTYSVLCPDGAAVGVSYENRDDAEDLARYMNEAFWAGREAAPTGALIAVGQEFVAYYRKNGGCSHCGGIPHTSTCFVGRTEDALWDVAGVFPVLKQLEAMRPDPHRHMSVFESFRILADLFRDVQESHSLLSVRGKVLGNKLPERIALLCARAEAGEASKKTLAAVRSALDEAPSDRVRR